MKPLKEYEKVVKERSGKAVNILPTYDLKMEEVNELGELYLRSAIKRYHILTYEVAASVAVGTLLVGIAIGREIEREEQNAQSTP